MNDQKAEAILEAIHEHVSCAWNARASCPIAERGDCTDRLDHDWPVQSLEYHLAAVESGVARLFQHMAKREEEAQGRVESAR